MCPFRSTGTLAGMNTRSHAVAATAAAGVSLLAAACGSGSTAAASTAAAGAASMDGYVQCMRSHAIPDYPAPASVGSTW